MGYGDWSGFTHSDTVYRPQPRHVDFRVPWRKHVEQRMIYYKVGMWTWYQDVPAGKFDDGVPVRKVEQ